MTLSDTLAEMLAHAPELGQSPGLAVSAAQSTDPIGNAQAVAHAANARALHAAAQKHGGVIGSVVGFLGRGVKTLENAAGTVTHALGQATGIPLAALNAPLQEVQHQYRYLHDVEATHGPIAATTEGLALGLGALGGGLLAGPEGAVLGAEAAGSVLGRTTYTDSWQRTQDGKSYVDPHTHSPVSLGRDLANRIFNGHHGTPYTVLSGVLDGLADLTLDPVAQVGGLVGDARAAEGAKGLLNLAFSGTRIGTAEEVERAVRQYPSIRNAFDVIARSSPAEVVRRWPQFQQIADRLGAATTRDAVTDVFREVGATQELVTTNKLPTLSFTHIPFAKLRMGIENANVPVLSSIARNLTLLPTVYDPKLAEYSNHVLSINDNHGAQALWRMVRWGDTGRVADDVVNTYLNTEVGSAERIRIFKNAVTKTLTGMVGKDLKEANPELAQKFYGAVEDLVGGAAAGKEAQYGLSVGGRNLSRVATEDGKALSAGITDNQIGKLALPDFHAMKRAAAEFKGGRSLFGKADDWLYENYTQRVFKKLALLSGGFALRVSAAEAIPAALREGFVNYVKDRADISLGKLGDKVSREEAGHIGQFVWHVLDGNIANTKDVDLATDMARHYGGHVVTPGLNASHHISAEVAGVTEKRALDLRRATEATPPRQRMGSDFGIFGRGDRNYTDYWHRWLSEVSQDDKSVAAAGEYLRVMQAGGSEAEATKAGAAAATKWLDSQPESHLRQYSRHTLTSPEAGELGLTPHEDWGRVVMENVKGATHAADGTPHVQLLRDVSEMTATHKQALDAIDPTLRPELVKGRMLLPDPSTSLDRIANAGHKKIIDPIINYLAREPIFFGEMKRQMAHLEAAAPEMAREEMLQLAASRATVRMTPFIHNILERSQFSDTARNWMPFWFAQEQAYKRVGRLLAEDPGAFRKYQLLFSSFADVGFHSTDDSGQQNVILPGTGWLTQGSLAGLKLLGLPVVTSTGSTFVGSISTLKTISPFLEGTEGAGIGIGPLRANFGPVVAIPLKAIASIFPEAQPIATSVLGGIGSSGSMWDTIIPNSTMRRVLDITVPGYDHQRSFNTAMVQTLQMMSARDAVDPKVKEWNDKKARGEDAGTYPGLVPPAEAGPQERQAFIQRLKGQTRILFALKALIGSVSPAAPQAQVGDANLRDEVRAEIQKAGSFAGGIDAFLTKHPDSTAYTVFGSDNLSGGPVSATKEAQDWVNAHQGFLKSYPNAAAFFVPQLTDAKFDQGIYNEQLAQGLRAKKTPEKFLDDLYIAAVNKDFFDHDYPAYQADLQAAKDSGDSDQVAAVRANWQEFMKQMNLTNPVWFNWFTSPTRDNERKRTLADLRTMFQRGSAPDSPNTEGIKGLLDDYEAHANALLAGHEAGWSADERKAEEDNWQAYLNAQAKQHPQLQPLIDKVLRRVTD